MSWLFPGFLAAGVAIALPVALHLLRRWPRRPVVFPALRFLVPTSRLANSRLQRVLRWLVLALRCAVLLLLAMTFARPFRGGFPDREYRAVVVVVDTSFSLQAAGRWALLRSWAVDRIGPLLPGDRMGVLATAPHPIWLVAPTTESDRALEALRTVSPGWTSARLEPALRTAAEALAALPADRREIVLVTDHQRFSWVGTDFNRTLAPGIRLLAPAVAAPVRRQAALLAPKLTPTPRGLAATVAIRNFTGPQSRVLQVYRDGGERPIQEERFELGAGELRSIVIELPGELPGAARFRFALDPDDLPADDTAYAVWQREENGLLLLDPAPAPNRTAPGATTDFVADALGATAGLKPAWQRERPPPTEWPVRAVAVLRNDASFTGASAERLNAFLAGGGSAVVFATGGPAAPAWLAARGIHAAPLSSRPEPWEVHDWQLEHPFVAALGRHRLTVLLNWSFREGWALPVDQVEPLAHWSDSQAAIGEVRVGAGRLLLCGFAPDRRAGDWPATPAFVQFIHQAPTYLATVQHATIVAGQTGQPLLLPGTLPGRWTALDGPAAAAAAIDVSQSVVPTQPGVYQFDRGPERVRFAVNLPPEESDLAPWDAGTPWFNLVANDPPRSPGAAAAPRAQAAASEAEQRAPLWWWVAAAVALLLLAEMGLSNRTAR